LSRPEEQKTMIIRQRVAAGVIVLAAGVACIRPAPGATTIELYPESPRHRSDGKVSGTALGTPLGFESFRNCPEYYYDATYAWFAADGPVPVELAIRGPVDRAVLRSVRKDIPLVRDGSKLAFTLPGPGNYHLQLPDLGAPEPGNPDSGTYTVLFFVDDLAALRADRLEVARTPFTDATQKGVASDPVKDQSRAIDAILARAGSIVFPAGIYRTSGLKVRSNTSIYLAPGAVLLGTDKSVAKRFLDLSDAENVRIFGPGTIDANDANTHIVNTENSRDITLEDSLYRNSRSWAIHLLRVDEARVRNVRVLNGKDGIDPDGARDVVIEDCCVLAKDDAIVVKTRTPRVPSERVTVRHCTVASDASALKVGTETRAPIKSVLFEDCAVFDSDRGLVIYARDGGAIEDVTWRDIRMSLVHWPHETGGSPFVFDITKRDGVSTIKNCRVENVETNQIVPSQLKGLNQAPLDGVAFNNIQIRVEAPPPPRKKQSRKQKLPLFVTSGPVTVAIEGLSVDWQGHEEAWAGITGDEPKSSDR
jgi:hypothetical protein